MTAFDYIAYGIRILVAGFALAVSLRRKEHIPLAIFCGSVASADIAGAAISTIIAQHPTPYTGADRILFHITQAIFLLWPSGIAALSWHHFLRRKPLPILALYLLAVLAVIAAYPALRQGALGWFYLIFRLLCLGTAAACFGRWVRLREAPSFEQQTTLAFVFLEVASLLAPISPQVLFTNWIWSQVVYFLLYMVLVATYARFLWLRRR